jgi:GGDEF domain-containing protein
VIKILSEKQGRARTREDIARLGLFFDKLSFFQNMASESG